MSLSVFKYEFRCVTEDCNVHVWRSEDESTPDKCPNNTEHTVDLNSLAIVDTVATEDVNISNSDVNLPVVDKAFPDRSGYNVHYHGSYGVARAGETSIFDVSYDDDLKLQGLMFKVDDNINDGSNHWDPVADQGNSGTGVIERGDEDACMLHDRTYLFTVSNKSGSAFDIDWESDASTSGTLNISGSNYENITVEEGLKLTFSGLENFADDDQYDLVIDHGDHITVQMVDVDGAVYPAGTVLATFANQWPVWINEEFQCLCPDAKDFFDWIYFRLIYTSTYGTNNVKIKFVPLTRTIPT